MRGIAIWNTPDSQISDLYSLEPAPECVTQCYASRMMYISRVRNQPLFAGFTDKERNWSTDARVHVSLLPTGIMLCTIRALGYM